MSSLYLNFKQYFEHNSELANILQILCKHFTNVCKSWNKFYAQNNHRGTNKESDNQGGPEVKKPMSMENKSRIWEKQL